jgi:hypothetical protein
MLNAILIGRRLLMIIMIYYDISLRTPRREFSRSSIFKSVSRQEDLQISHFQINPFSNLQINPFSNLQIIYFLFNFINSYSLYARIFFVFTMYLITRIAFEDMV